MADTTICRRCRNKLAPSWPYCPFCSAAAGSADQRSKHAVREAQRDLRITGPALVLLLLLTPFGLLGLLALIQTEWSLTIGLLSIIPGGLLIGGTAVKLLSRGWDTGCFLNAVIFCLVSCGAAVSLFIFFFVVCTSVSNGPRLH